ncbi:MAG TPA: TIGR03118 family protein [Edaphobacter sp.]
MKGLSNLIALAASVSLLPGIAFAQHYTQVNLVANVSGVAPVTDPQLINPWGLSRSSSSPWWVSDAGTGLSTLYNGAGAKQALVVTVPKSDPNSPTFPTGTPTGTIANGNPTDFLLAAGKPSTFLFSTIDGTIAGWNSTVAATPGAAGPSTNAVTVFRTKDGSSYTGLTVAEIDGKRYLYAANFGKGRVDVFDNAFHPVKLKDDDHRGPFDRYFGDDRFFGGDDKPFTDDRLPRFFVPFNVQAIGGNIVVTYALHLPGQQFESDGPGLGYVDVFSAKGKLLSRLEHGDWLNAPWGVALAPLDFGHFSHDLLVAQFAGGGTSESSGYIAAYDLTTGKFDGLLQDASGKPLAINGIWAISPANSAAAGSYDTTGAPAGELYFTAGPDHGTGGLFGYLKPVSTELIQGNAQ